MSVRINICDWISISGAELLSLFPLLWPCTLHSCSQASLWVVEGCRKWVGFCLWGGFFGLFLLPNFRGGSWLIIRKVMVYGPSDSCRFRFLLSARFWMFLRATLGDLLWTPSLGRRKYFASKSSYSVVRYCKLKNNNLRNISRFSREWSLVQETDGQIMLPGMT